MWYLQRENGAEGQPEETFQKPTPWLYINLMDLYGVRIIQFLQ